MGAQGRQAASVQPGGKPTREATGNFSEAGRGDPEQSVSPAIYNFDRSEDEGGDWFERMVKPFDPESEGIKGYGTEEREERKEEEEVEADKEEEEGEEAQRAKGTRAPTKPSKEEVDDHMLTHLPFRSWCPHCVRGKSKGKPHRKGKGEEKEIPTLALDYTFMYETQREHEEKGMPILVIKDLKQESSGTGMLFAHVVPQKGVQPYAVKTLAGAIAQLGHQEIVLKSDGEPAIVALKEAAKRERNERIVIEASPVKESRSNGAIESAVQQVQGQFRTMKDALENKIGARLSPNSAIIPWMVIHSARTINRYQVGEDGKTAHRRWNGEDFKRDVAEIGETVLYLKPGTQGEDKFLPRWEKGIWL